MTLDRSAGGPKRASQSACAHRAESPKPDWLRPSDLDALAHRFAPLDVAQARHLAFVFAEGSTPVEVLIPRLVAAGLAPDAARRFIAELRVLREQTRLRAMPRAAAPAGDVASALNAPAASCPRKAGDDEQAARAISKPLHWLVLRARWLLTVSRDKAHRVADRLAAERPTDSWSG